MKHFVKNAKKKAFTLVELLVVIAILAILATVSVVGYLGFTEKANKSVDEQLCAQYNTLLKAQSALDDDITLPELITLIEENGINSNQFRTLSKSYTFAYYPDPTNGQVVLLDKDTGDVVFPEGATSVTADKLWATYPKNQKLQKGVNNYTLMSSVIYNAHTIEGETYNFDLNKNSMIFNVNPTETISVTNGSAVFKEASKPSNITIGTNAEELTSKNNDFKLFDQNTKFESLAPKTMGEPSGNKLTISNKKYFSGEEEYKSTHAQNSFSKDDLSGITDLIIENCSFTGLRLNIEKNLDLNVVLKNCVFNNTNSYAFDANTVKNLTVENCKVLNCNRGMNLSFATENTIIKGNTYNLTHIETPNKGEVKDNAIQFRYDNPADLIDNGNEPESAILKSTIKVLVSNNIVEKANAFVTMHGAFATSAELTNVKSFAKIMEKEAAKNADARFITFAGNKHKGIAKFAKDPGVTEDTGFDDFTTQHPDLVPTQKDRLAAYGTTCAKMESFID